MMGTVSFDDQVFTSTAPRGCCQVGLDALGQPMTVESCTKGVKVYACSKKARWHYIKRPKGFDRERHISLMALTCNQHRPDPDALPDDVTERCLIE